MAASVRGACGVVVFVSAAGFTAAAGAAVLPTGAIVTAGRASVARPSATQMVVRQSTPTAILSWHSFSIGRGAGVAFENGSGATLNRVTGNIGSRIDGDLSATGSLFLINPSGVVIGKTGRVDTGGSFFASTLDVPDAQFDARGPLTFSGNSNAAVVNEGQIGSLGGDVALIASRVENAGTIAAPHGTAALAAGYRVLVRDRALAGGKFAVEVGGADTAAGTVGTIRAANVELRADGGNVYALAGNTHGVVAATGVNDRGGHIFLTAPGGTVDTAGSLVASRSTAHGAAGGDIAIMAADTRVGGDVVARGTGAAGGTIVATASRRVTLTPSAVLDASGTDGGTILVGGDVHGGATPGADVVPGPVADAMHTTVERGARLDVSGTTGDGGKVVVWSERHTDFAGRIEATGAPEQRGGFAEVSSRGVLGFTGRVDLTSVGGTDGTLLLDPEDVRIANGSTNGGTLSGGIFTPSGDGSVISTADLENALAGGNVEITTGGAGSTGSQAGDITVADPVSWATASSLTLSAYHDVDVGAGLTSTGGGAVTLRADNGATGQGTVNFANGAQVSTAGPITIFYNPADNAGNDGSVNAVSYTTPTDYSGDVTGGGALTSYMLVNTPYDLQNVQNNLSGDYALGGDIDTTPVPDHGNGFTPIGSSPTEAFTGTLNGENHAISNLFVNFTNNAAAGEGVGLFGFIGANGNVANLEISSGNVSGSANVDMDVGLLAGENAGTVSNVTVAGYVSGSGVLGGLVGGNTGTVAHATADASVTSLSTGSVLGGLAGANGAEGNSEGTITDSTVTAGSGLDVNYTTVADVGGFVGENFGTLANDTTGVSVANNVTPLHPEPFGYATGGFAALNGATGIMKGDSATGAVQGDPLDPTGGLVGINFGQITASSYTASVDPASGMPTKVNGSVDTGGLVGDNAGSIDDSTATTEVIGGASPTGGLVAVNAATGVVANSAANASAGAGMGSVQGGDASTGVGGLVGNNFGSVTGSSSTESVDATGFVGGLVGFNERGSSVSASSASGLVTGQSGDDATGSAGGLVGENAGSISASFATSSPSGAVVGGLVGRNEATGLITNSWAGGALSGNAGIGYLAGGFVGENAGSIDGAYATGATNGLYGNEFTDFGGFVGLNDAGGTISQAYATGAGANGSGGFAGDNEGKVTAGFFDPNTTGQAVGAAAGDSTGITGLSQSPYLPYSAASYPGFDFTHTWYIEEGTSRPLLLAQSVSTITNATQLALVNANLAGTYTLGNDIDLSGGFAPIGSSTNPFTGSFNGDGHTITGFSDSSTTASALGLFAEIGTGGQVSNLTLFGVQLAGGSTGGVGALAGINQGTVTDVTAEDGNVSGGSATGGLVGDNGGTIIGGGTTLGVTGNGVTGGIAGTNSGSVSGTYALGSVSGPEAGGLVGDNSGAIKQSYASGAVNATGGGAVAGGLVGSNGAGGSIDNSYAVAGVTGASSTIGGLVGTNAGTITDTYASGPLVGGATTGGLVGDNSGDVTGSYWDSHATGAGVGSATGAAAGIADVASAPYAQSSYPDFNFTSNWYLITGATRPMLLSEYSTTITTSHQLQLMALDPGASYTLASTVDMAGTSSGDVWNPATGFAPVGDGATPFSGAFSDENGAAIMNLHIASSASDVGLFGVLGSSATLNDVFLPDEAVVGETGASVGGVAGLNEGAAINGAYTTGSVSGGATTGGLVGGNAGSLTNTYSTASVTGTTDAGGLVGINDGTVDSSYASGMVKGATAGGIAGTNTGAITNDYFDAKTTGQVNPVGSDDNAASTLAWDMSGEAYNGYYSSPVLPGDQFDSLGGSSGSAWTGAGTRPILTAELSNIITTPHQLQYLFSAAGGSGTYYIGNDIDLSPTGGGSDIWNPAAGFGALDDPNPSAYVLNGEGHTIGNLHEVGAGASGLFWMNSDLIENIDLADVDLQQVPAIPGVQTGTSGDGAKVGAAAGQNTCVLSSGCGVIDDVTASGTIVVDTPQSLVGGLVGSDIRGTVENSSSSVSVTTSGASSDVGGLVGLEYVDSPITGSFASGAVTTSGLGTATGGLVGTMIGGQVKNSLGTGDVASTGALSPTGGQFGNATVDPATGAPTRYEVDAAGMPPSVVQQLPKQSIQTPWNFPGGELQYEVPGQLGGNDVGDGDTPFLSAFKLWPVASDTNPRISTSNPELSPSGGGSPANMTIFPSGSSNPPPSQGGGNPPSGGGNGGPQPPTNGGGNSPGGGQGGSVPSNPFGQPPSRPPPDIVGVNGLNPAQLLGLVPLPPMELVPVSGTDNEYVMQPMEDSSSGQGGGGQQDQDQTPAQQDAGDDGAKLAKALLAPPSAQDSGSDDPAFKYGTTDVPGSTPGPQDPLTETIEGTPDTSGEVLKGSLTRNVYNPPEDETTSGPPDEGAYQPQKAVPQLDNSPDRIVLEPTDTTGPVLKTGLEYQHFLPDGSEEQAPGGYQPQWATPIWDHSLDATGTLQGSATQDVSLDTSVAMLDTQGRVIGQGVPPGEDSQSPPPDAGGADNSPSSPYAEKIVSAKLYEPHVIAPAPGTPKDLFGAGLIELDKQIGAANKALSGVVGKYIGAPVDVLKGVEQLTKEQAAETVSPSGVAGIVIGTTVGKLIGPALGKFAETSQFGKFRDNVRQVASKAKDLLEYEPAVWNIKPDAADLGHSVIVGVPAKVTPIAVNGFGDAVKEKVIDYGTEHAIEGFNEFKEHATQGFKDFVEGNNKAVQQSSRSAADNLLDNPLPPATSNGAGR